MSKVTDEHTEAQRAAIESAWVEARVLQKGPDGAPLQHGILEREMREHFGDTGLPSVSRRLASILSDLTQRGRIAAADWPDGTWRYLPGPNSAVPKV